LTKDPGFKHHGMQKDDVIKNLDIKQKIKTRISEGKNGAFSC
jgi:hypothetical protein